MENKEVMACTTESTSHGNCHSVISSVSELNLIVKLLIEYAVFDYQLGRGSNKSEFINLYLCGTKSIIAGGPLNLYQHKARRN